MVRALAGDSTMTSLCATELDFPSFNGTDSANKVARSSSNGGQQSAVGGLIQSQEAVGDELADLAQTCPEVL
jgi:hypothetical protein